MFLPSEHQRLHLVFYTDHLTPRVLHSFPTRRSSDLMWRLISSGSKSMVEVPSSTRPRRSVIPVLKRIASVSEVFPAPPWATIPRSEEHTSELQSRENIVCRLLLEKKKKHNTNTIAPR